MRWWRTSAQDSAGTLILESRTTRSKLFSQKECWSPISLNGLKSELCWLSRYQEMDENVKKACGDEPVKEQLYSGKTLICSCSAQQGETFEPSSCSLSKLARERPCCRCRDLITNLWNLVCGHSRFPPINSLDRGYSINCFQDIFGYSSATLTDTFRILRLIFLWQMRLRERERFIPPKDRAWITMRVFPGECR